MCAHAGFGDTLLHSWQGMSAQKALGRPEAPTQLAGMSLFLTDRVEPAAFAKLMEFPHLLSDEVDKLDAVAELLNFPDIVRHPEDLLALAKLLEFPGMVPHVMSLLRTQNISFPITIGSQLKISLPNRGIPDGCLGRDNAVTFRAMKQFHGKRGTTACGIIMSWLVKTVWTRLVWVMGVVYALYLMPPVLFILFYGVTSRIMHTRLKVSLYHLGSSSKRSTA